MTHAVAPGQRFSRLTVLRQTDSRSGARCWQVACDCGNEAVVRSSALVTGKTRSCGCLMRETAALIGAQTATHGRWKSPTYSTWTAMKARCLNPSRPNYSDYGGRGITVCERWLSFENFLADMGHKPPGKSIERLNNDKGYEPGNCCWATEVEQQRNKRSVRHITAHGKTQTIPEWSAERGISQTVIYQRLHNGWAPDVAVTATPRQYTKEHSA